jgi:hypothetical protein
MRTTYIKPKARLWLKELIFNSNILDKEIAGNREIFSFPMVGFADEPLVFVHPVPEGLQIGYHSIEWDGQEPLPIMVTKHSFTFVNEKD